MMRAQLLAALLIGATAPLAAQTTAPARADLTPGSTVTITPGSAVPGRRVAPALLRHPLPRPVGHADQGARCSTSRPSTAASRRPGRAAASRPSRSGSRARTGASTPSARWTRIRRRSCRPSCERPSCEDIFQDQISAAHPAGALVVPPLLDAVGVRSAAPRLVVMPDDPALGEFRQEFAGMLGTLEERATEAEAGAPGFEGAVDVKDTEELFEKLDKNPDERVNTRAFLAARLMDLFLGDWDRHVDQWKWIQLAKDGQLSAGPLRSRPGVRPVRRLSAQPGPCERIPPAGEVRRAPTRTWSASTGTRASSTAACCRGWSGRPGTRWRPSSRASSPTGHRRRGAPAAARVLREGRRAHGGRAQGAARPAAGGGAPALSPAGRGSGRARHQREGRGDRAAGRRRIARARGRRPPEGRHAQGSVFPAALPGVRDARTSGCYTLGGADSVAVEGSGGPDAPRDRRRRAGRGHRHRRRCQALRRGRRQPGHRGGRGPQALQGPRFHQRDRGRRRATGATSGGSCRGSRTSPTSASSSAPA